MNKKCQRDTRFDIVECMNVEFYTVILKYETLKECERETRHCITAVIGESCIGRNRDHGWYGGFGVAPTIGRCTCPWACPWRVGLLCNCWRDSLPMRDRLWDGQEIVHSLRYELVSLV